MQSHAHCTAFLPPCGKWPSLEAKLWAAVKVSDDSGREMTPKHWILTNNVSVFCFTIVKILSHCWKSHCEFPNNFFASQITSEVFQILISVARRDLRINPTLYWKWFMITTQNESFILIIIYFLFKILFMFSLFLVKDKVGILQLLGKILCCYLFPPERSSIPNLYSTTLKQHYVVFFTLK